MTFGEWLKYSYITQAIEVAVMVVGLYAYKAWRKRHPSKLTPMPDNKCSTADCRLGAGHIMPCWDGTPDPNYKTRTGKNTP